MFTLLTTARETTEATLLVARLRDAGIPCMRGSSDGPRGTPRAAREIYVDEASLPRAQEILEEDRGDFDEAELARLSEEAGERWTLDDRPTELRSDTADSSVNVVPPVAPRKGHRVRHVLARLTGGEPDVPHDPFGR